MAQQWSEPITSGVPARGAPPGDFAPPSLTGRELRRLRVWLAVYGVLAILAGGLAIAIPAVASITIAIFIGWLLVFAGILMGVHRWSHRHDRRLGVRPWLTAALTLLIGLYLVIFPLSGTITLTLLLAIWFVGSGALLLSAWWSLRRLPGMWATGVNGAVSVLLGLLIAVDLPSSAAWAVGLLVGINLVFWGVRVLIEASRLEAGPARAS
jgi:uncharacterized membrane protein HdeD (DUF308 family)